MPSFDIVSELNMHEVNNALDQANREVTTRFDFKDSGARFELKDNTLQLQAQTEFQLKQMLDVLQLKLSKRGIDLACLDIKKPELSGKQARQAITLKQGIDQSLGKEIIRVIKDKRLKVQASLQGDQVRVTGKKKDDLQEAIGALRNAKLALPLQYINFRD